jgi:Uma2 family endonuclease
MVDQAIAVQTKQIGGKITFDEFLRLTDDLYAELVDGEVIELMPPSIKHNDLAAFLFYFMLTYIGYRSVGRVFHAPTALKLLGRAHGREPDLMYVRTEHADRVKNNYVESPADAVFEIVSPESIERDYNDKFNEYQAAGIPEYWLIDPAAQRVRLYHLNATGKYEVIIPTEDGHQHSTEISGFYLPVALLWQDPLPNPLQILEIVKALIAPNEQE